LRHIPINLEKEDLFSHDYSKEWPVQKSYPLNLSTYDREVHDLVVQDIKQSIDYLIITAFTSIEYFVDFYSKTSLPVNLKTRMVLGYEPIIRSNRKIWSIDKLSEEVINHWIEKGISILQCGSVINLIEKIKDESVFVKLSDKLHAKIYVGQEHAILGSSNFSYAGLRRSKEANVRFSKSRKEYLALKQIAENFYREADDFNDGLIKLLNRLLKVVSWQEALSRAIAELLEGKWIDNYPESFKELDQIKIWPTQRQAIGQALYILDNQGSVLVADPTGSGKTRTGACIQLSAYNRFWVKGAGHKSKSIIVCPPIVDENWKLEYADLNVNPPERISHGALSAKKSIKFDKSIDHIKRANIMLIDEAHNFLHYTSGRSRTLLNSLADHTLLFTATPINKRIEDLLRLIELLDIDNLSDHALETFKRLARMKSLKGQAEHEEIKGLISHFMVRRTKLQLNKMIAENPKLYKNNNGQECKYPQQVHLKYKTSETSGDQALANEINDLCNKLKGVINLQKLEMDEDKRNNPEEIVKYVDQRKKIAAAISRYTIQAMLRSSRIALVEHISGTKAALKEFNIEKSTKKDSGHIIDKLEKLSTGLPKRNFELQSDWISDETLYAKVCEEEIDLYRKILAATLKMSESREQGKVDLIYNLFKKNKLLLAFDSRGLTLDYLGNLFSKKYVDKNCLVVKGTDKSNKRKAQEIFGLDSKENDWVAFCSDSMSEGVNLQQGSALVLLDMPSVVRVIEQRIGRLDRMDSPHEKIEIHWPTDSKAFALKTDIRFFKTLAIVANVLGSNFDFPVDFMDVQDRIIKTDVAIEEYKKLQGKDQWDGIRDAFQSVREMIMGDNAIIKLTDYNKIKDTKESIRCRVSLIKASEPWAFFAIRGSQNHAPQWFYLELPKDKNESDFQENRDYFVDLNSICEKLRARLTMDTENLEWSDESEGILNKFLNNLEKNQLKLLPNKKRRALEMLKRLLDKYLSVKSIDSNRKKLIIKLLDFFAPNISDDTLSVNYYQFAQLWLDLIQPRMIDLKKSNKRWKNVIDLDVLRKDLEKNPVPDNELKKMLDNVVTIDRLDKRIASCIVGIPSLT
jgi:superfamily II DNA or RNA helicase